ncbi:MAG: glycosyltransferase family 2 protein [Rhodobiaceae bacterium]|nr:glycosyltransferase family 2 protein [Rhodobiaceae bacterium]MCC0015068.1 glycosyltransferase family 2 protein [Rhodobiaceae bacterium]MCC0052923.1 glycosyltransferase family 2 protein [Rhodobiaceae bacterium]
MPTPSAAEISVVIPARNEADNLPILIDEIRSAFEPRGIEIVVVDDGSTDSTPSVLEKLASEDQRIRFVRHARSCGQSGALWTGVRAARAPIVATLDGDGQNDPAFLPALVDCLSDQQVGIAAGQRTGRRDSKLKQVSSRIANKVRGAMLKDGTRDSGCGLKAFRREAFMELPYFQGLHRFLPALFVGDGWKVAHVDVKDRSRRHGTSNYGILDRLAVGILDLFGVWWLIRRRERHPLKLSKD